MSSSETVGSITSLMGACNEARELARRRVNPQTPVTPVTPVMPTTPMLAAHIFAEGNIMEDLQLAAELGKTLLERNRELELNVKQLQNVNDDQTQEIEYLSKQTAALREVNDSRLRIYEQLEISIQDLEKNNQRLTAENISDKRKIKSLSDTIEQLESKGEDLQKSLDDTKQAHLLEEQQRGRSLIKKPQVEDLSFKRSFSCENSLQVSEELLIELTDLKSKYENSQEKLRLLQIQNYEEDKRREEMEIEMSCVSQENTVLLAQLSVLKEKEVNVRCLEDELASLDDTTSSRFCRKCMGLTDDTMSNQTMQDITDDIEELEFDRVPTDCAVVRLKNGGYAWGSQESLASMGRILSGGNSAQTSPKNSAREEQGNSLLSELDTQYRILIEKYEALVQTRELPKISDEDKTTIINSGVDELSGPMSLMDLSHKGVSLRCQRCTTCTCDLKPTDPRPKSNLEEFSEVETSSSGFSEGESRSVCKWTQTETGVDSVSPLFPDDPLTPIAMSSLRCLDLTSPLNPCERRFQSRPEYKALFQEIFDVLKKTVDENEANKAFTRTLMQSQQLMIDNEKSFSPSERDENEENKNPNEMKKNNRVVHLQKDEVVVAKKPEVLKRPDSLPLASSHSARSASKNRRKKRRQRHDSQQSDVTAASNSRNVSTTRETKKESPVVSKPSTENAKSAEDTTASKSRCKHKQRSKKHRQAAISKQRLTLAASQEQEQQQQQQQQSSILLPSAHTKKLAFSHPSVEVAKLRRLDMTYAEVLKDRHSRERRY